MNNLLFISILIIIILYSVGAKNKKQDSKIPKTIFQTYKTNNVPNIVKERWLQLNPHYKYKFYDDVDCFNFLQRNYGLKYANVFKNIKDGPIKSDFWRLCILYKYGGVYADIDIIPYFPIDSFVDKNTTLYTCVSDINIDNNNLNPHFIAVTPNNELIFSCIKKYMTEKINTKYSYNNWSITNIMNNILKTFLDVDKLYEGIYSKNNQIIQLSQEVCPDKKKNINTCYIKQDNIQILSNRDASIYSNKKHSFF